jgi:2-haloacid dehalogenase
MPSLTVCFDALGTCFSLDPLVRAVDELLGERLVAAGQGARTVVDDWVSEGHGELPLSCGTD